MLCGPRLRLLGGVSSTDSDAAESGLFPGVVYYFSMWYKRRERQFRISLFFSAAALAGSFGGILAYVGRPRGRLLTKRYRKMLTYGSLGYQFYGWHRLVKWMAMDFHSRK